MAVPLLAKEMADDYIDLLGQRDSGAVRLSDLERERYGWTHAEAAGVMARGWNLPEEFAALIDVHTEVDELAVDAESKPGALAVAISALLPACADPVWHEQSKFESIYRDVSAQRDAPSITQILQEVDDQFAEFAPVLKLATPAKSLVDRYGAGAVE